MKNLKSISIIFSLFSVLLLFGCNGGVVIRLFPEKEEIPGDNIGGIVNSSSSSSFNPASVRKIAIIVQPGKNVPQRQIEDEFISILFRKGYQIASRSDLDQILEELHFQNTELTDIDAAKIGKMLNVPVVLVVAVTELYISDYTVRVTRGIKNPTTTTERRYKAHATMGARLLSVEKGEILWIANESAQSRGGYESKSNISFTSSLSFLSQRIANAFPAR